MRRAGFGFLWLILGIVTLGIVGASAYNAGLTAGLAASATETAVAVVPAYGWGVGFGFGWILFPISSCSCFRPLRPHRCAGEGRTWLRPWRLGWPRLGPERHGARRPAPPSADARSLVRRRASERWPVGGALRAPERWPIRRHAHHERLSAARSHGPDRPRCRVRASACPR
jgi:hypothetical protein